MESTPTVGEQDTVPQGADELELARQRASLRQRLFGENERVVIAGRYALVERIGAGGMGTVYRAHDAELDRDVAIKLLRNDRSGVSGQLRLLRESRVLAKLSHPNVVAIFDVVDLEGDVAIVMELVQGRSLRQWADDTSRRDREILSVYLQAGRGLAAAHAEGLVHRDFKPDNVMVAEDGRVRVMDFGLARPTSTDETDPDTSDGSGRQLSEDARLTQTGNLVGTPAYMAPEQFQGNPVDARTDQFSFCVSLWEQLFGQRPYSGDTPGELAANVASGQVREPASARRAGRLRSILERGLRPDPDGRWPDLASLLDALEHDAARGRRRVAFTAVGAVLVALGAFGVGSAWLDQSRREACASRADAIDEVWNDSARTRLREAVAGTGVPNAESAFEHATPHLDEYAATWRATYAELCVATEVDRIRGAERWSASQACLDDRRSSLDVLLEALSDEPSDVGVMGMVGSVAGLDRIEPCENDAALDLAFADVAPSAEGSQALRRDLQRLRALEATGKYEDATALATRLVAQTQGHHSARLRVEVLEAAGRAAEGRGDYDDAHALIGRAFDRALEAGEDDLAFEAASALIPIVADGQGQLPEAHVWARMASGLEARLGSGDELRRALLHGNLGNMLESAGRLDEAIEEHGEALALYESVLGPNHPSTAVAHHGLGSTQLRRGHHAEALASFSRALEIFERAYGPNHPHVGRALNNIGNAKSGLGRLDDAERAYRRACDVLEATLGPEHLVVAMARVNLAETHLARGRVDDAERIFLESLARIEAGLGPEHPEVARARRHLADLYDATGRTDEAARYRDAPPG